MTFLMASILLIREILETKHGKKIPDEFLGGFALADVPTGRIREFLFRITKVDEN